MSLGGKELFSVITGSDQEAARSHTEPRPLSPARGPGAKKPQEPKTEEDPFDFSKTAEKVSEAIPRRYDDEDSLSPTIYVVPRDLAEGRKDAYEPAVVCIGPLFHQTERNKKPYRKLERYKWCCVRRLIVNAETGPGRRGAWIPDVHTPLLRKCLDTMRDLEPRIRDLYDSMDDMGGGEKLALMMLLDGCFLLHRLLKLARRSTDDDDDDDWTQVFGRCGVWGLVTRDLLLLKNQIPFVVLRALFKHLKSRAGERDDVLIEGGLRLFASLRPGPTGSSSSITCRDVHHLLHLLYLSIDISPAPKPGPQDELQWWVPCATELVEAGVSFRAKQQQGTATLSFLDVSFRGGFRRGVLEIPPLELYDYSEPLFRNLIAFEQTYPHTPGHVTAYAIFMDCLIKTQEDMRLLHQSGVLVSHMNGDMDVATRFFSRVCAQAHISSGQSYLAGVMGAVVRYQSRHWPRWRTALVRNYFSNPWVTTAFLVGSVILVATLLQTFFAVYGYFKPPA
uniref:Uncharacterized protein n=1 Tax=Arundo donax TaxID=35708 RepID=A0A0A8YGL3_ARUDO